MWKEHKILCSVTMLATECNVKIQEDTVKVLNPECGFIRHDVGESCGWFVKIDFTEEGKPRLKEDY